MPRDAIAMSALLAEAAPEPDPPAGATIRPLRSDDGRSLGVLMSEAFAGTVDDDGSLVEDHIQVASRTLAGQFGPIRADASLVAVPDGHPAELLGAAVVTVWRGLPMIAFALVQPSWQRRGLGAALLARSANSLRAAGEARWTLSVTRHNPAIRLYERFGFSEDRSLVRRRA